MLERHIVATANHHFRIFDIWANGKTIALELFENEFARIGFGSEVDMLDTNGFATVETGSFEPSARKKFHIERQALYRLAHHVVRMEQQQLVVATAITACTRTKTLHKRVLIRRIILDHHFQLGGKLRRPTAVLVVGNAQTNDQSDEQQVPMMQQKPHPLHNVERRFLFVLLGGAWHLRLCIVRIFSHNFLFVSQHQIPNCEQQRERRCDDAQEARVGIDCPEFLFCYIYIDDIVGIDVVIL